jgi:uroporphyrinogen decarboxylase
MNSRERILAAINHDAPDRIPIDLGATPSSGISAIAYHNLKQYLHMNFGKTRIYDVVQQIAQPEPEILDFFKADVIDLGQAYNTEDSDWYQTDSHGIPVYYPKWFHPTKNPNGSIDVVDSDGDRIATMPINGYFFDQTYHPYNAGYPTNYSDLPNSMSKVLWSALVHSPWDHATEPNFWENLRQKALNLRKSTDKAILLSAGCNLFEWGTFLRGLDRFLVDMIKIPGQVEKLLDALMEKHLANLEKICRYVGDVVDIIRLGDDLGTNDRPFMRPAVYRQLFKPRHKKLCDYIKNRSHMHIFLHSCGSIAPLIPDLIDCGFEILNPVQINNLGMEPDKLKREFGSKITFWGGGADTRNVLPRKTPIAVKTHVSELLKIFSPGGGFVFNQVHNILPDVSPENIVAMYEAVHNFK